MRKSRSVAAVKSSNFGHAMLDAEIEIVPYNSGWGLLPFLEERKNCFARSRAWADVVKLSIVGSTPFAGMSAKPTIDIMAPVNRSVVSLQATAVWLWRRVMSLSQTKLEQMASGCKPSPERRTHHLYLASVQQLIVVGAIGLQRILRQEPKILFFCLRPNLESLSWPE